MKTKILLKIGGRAFDDTRSYDELAGSINKIPDVDFIIVHGGGAEISEALKAANRPTRFIDGIRVTEKQDIEIVEQVLSETVNGRIASCLEINHVPCTRMSGKTEHLLVAEPIQRQGHDYGFVGQIKKVNPDIIEKSLRAGNVPVVSPISADEQGNSYNVNADSAASALAVGAGCTDLVFFTDVTGVKSGENLLTSLTIHEARQLISQGIIKDGMVAKMESAFDALKGHVKRVHITCWQGVETLQNIFSQNSPSGTTIHI
ncbi:acetylglutamate kinase [candidate division KSB1 bacterium]|nr:acetylglutamate kinase [candidate division KSB1 bacterium]